MNLGMFFTRGVSLRQWAESGLFEREVLIYKKYLDKGIFEEIFWFTYGADDDLFEKNLKQDAKLPENIRIVPMPKVFGHMGRIGVITYSIILAIIQRSIVMQCNLLKTNQMDGSYSAVLAKLLYGIPLIVRTGYTLTQLERKINPHRWFRNKLFEWMERIAYKYADLGIVASKHNKTYLIDRYGVPDDKIKIVPNYVDTQIFRPITEPTHENGIIFVGRFSEEKNLFALIEAVAKQGLALDLVGRGGLQPMLKQHASSCGATVNWLGTVPNGELPNLLNQYRYFILPSFFEGMPKALLEGMACGCLCIGTDTTGINEIIEDGINGVLIHGTSTQAIVEALSRAASSDAVILKRCGLQTIANTYSLEAVWWRELQAIQKIVPHFRLAS